MKKTIIFDFDGTIADTFVLVREILKDLSKELGYKKPTDADIELLKTQHPKEVMKSVGISPFKVPLLMYRVKTEMHKHMQDVKPIKGIEEALQDLKSQHHILGIVTSNNEKNVLAFLKKNHMDIFDFIQAESSLFGKARVLSKVIKEHAIPKNEAIYVGDEIRDIEAAHKIGIKVISVSWGFNEKNALGKFHPDVLIDKPQELKSSVNTLQ